MEELKQQNEVLMQRLEKAKEVFKDQKAQLESRNAKIAELTKDIEELKAKASGGGEELAAAKAKNSELENKIMELENKWNEQVSENDDLADKLADANAKVAQATQTISQYEVSCKEANAKIEADKNQIATLANSLKEFETQYNEKCNECKKQTDEVNKLNEMVKNGKEAYDAVAADNGKLKAELEKKNNELVEANKKLATAKTSTTNIQNEVKDVIKRVQNLDNSLTTNFNIFA